MSVVFGALSSARRRFSWSLICTACPVRASSLESTRVTGSCRDLISWYICAELMYTPGSWDAVTYTPLARDAELVTSRQRATRPLTRWATAAVTSPPTALANLVTGVAATGLLLNLVPVLRLRRR
jgi:hypothetical protein